MYIRARCARNLYIRMYKAYLNISFKPNNFRLCVKCQKGMKVYPLYISVYNVLSTGNPIRHLAPDHGEMVAS